MQKRQSGKHTDVKNTKMLHFSFTLKGNLHAFKFGKSAYTYEAKPKSTT